jgi:hypothetical protein
MTTAKGRGRSRERDAAPAPEVDNDRAWASIFAIVIIAGLALAALFFYMSSGSNAPARHSSVRQDAPATATSAATQRP